MVITVCLLVYAALEYRIQQALRAHQTTLPDQERQPIHNFMARLVSQSFVGIRLLLMPGPWPCVLNLTKTNAHLLRLLRQSYEVLYS